MSSKSRCRVQPGRRARGLILGVLCPAVLAGGCAHQPQYQQASSYAGGPRQTAAAVPIPVEMEDDGRPAQLPPRADVRRAADDPTQPWSPNYGGPAQPRPVAKADQVPVPVRPSSEPRARRVAWAADAD